MFEGQKQPEVTWWMGHSLDIMFFQVFELLGIRVSRALLFPYLAPAPVLAKLEQVLHGDQKVLPTKILKFY